MPGLLVRVRTGLLIPDGSVSFQSMAELLSDEADAWSAEEPAKLRRTITRLRKISCIRPCICSYTFVCMNQTPQHLNQNLKQREPGHTPAGVLTVHEFGSNELLFGVFIRRWNVLPDVYLAVLNAEQNSTR